MVLKVAFTLRPRMEKEQRDVLQSTMKSLVKSLRMDQTTALFVILSMRRCWIETDTVQVGLGGTVVLMLKTQIGLGVLSIPQVFHSLGLIPGVIVLLIIATMTSWSNYIVGVFKLRHADVYGIDDVGRKLFGRIGYEFFGITFALCMSDPPRK